MPEHPAPVMPLLSSSIAAILDEVAAEKPSRVAMSTGYCNDLIEVELPGARL